MVGIYTHQSQTIISFPMKKILDKLIKFIPLIASKKSIVHTIFLLGTAVPVWSLGEFITPQVVRAYTARGDILVDRLSADENYETLLRRSEAAARAAAQRAFDQDILVTDISMVISVQNYGSIAPVLELNVSRSQWRHRPDPQVWATYYRAARSLLLFDKYQKQTQTAIAPTQQLTPNGFPIQPNNSNQVPSSVIPPNSIPPGFRTPNPNASRRPLNVPQFSPQRIPVPRPPTGRR
jgi:hypothetical protein